MADGVQVYVDAVRAELEPGDLLLVEQPFSLDQLRPPGEMFGTADAVIYKPKLRRLLVFDLKYGAGVVVEAVGNPQGRYYGLGACMALADRPVSEVEIVIVQPRAPHPAGPIRRETISAFELVEWSADLLEAAERTLDPEAPLVPGAWCRFCPAAGICPALREQALGDRPGRVCCGAAALAAVPGEPAGRGGRAAARRSRAGRALDPGAPRPCARRARGGTDHSRVEAGPEARRSGAGATRSKRSSSCRRSGCPRTSSSSASSRALPRSRSWLAPAASASSLIWSSPKATARRWRARPITTLRFCPAWRSIAALPRPVSV